MLEHSQNLRDRSRMLQRAARTSRLALLLRAGDLVHSNGYGSKAASYLPGGGGGGGEQSGSERGLKAVFHAYLLSINVHDGCQILWREVRSSVPMSASAASAMTTAPNSRAVRKRSPERATK